MNVLTGWRNTGKSSLIDIIEYCFGRKTLTVSEGKIQRTVGWYGLILRNEDKFAFSGRPAPRKGTPQRGRPLLAAWRRNPSRTSNSQHQLQCR